jgi:hypothetical protein
MGVAAVIVVLAAAAGVYFLTRSDAVNEVLSLGSIGRSAGVVADSGDPAPPISGVSLEINAELVPPLTPHSPAETSPRSPARCHLRPPVAAP